MDTDEAILLAFVAVEVSLRFDDDLGAVDFKFKVTINIVKFLAPFAGDKDRLVIDSLLVNCVIYLFKLFFEIFKL